MIIKNQKGTAIVEFGIVLPLLILLAVGIIEIGLLYYNNQVIVNASREGARAGIVRWKHDDDTLYEDDEMNTLIDGIVQNYCSQRLITFGTNNPPVVVTTGVNGDFQDDLSVKVTYDYTFLVPAVLHSGITKSLTGETVMKMEPVV